MFPSTNIVHGLILLLICLFIIYSNKRFNCIYFPKMWSIILNVVFYLVKNNSFSKLNLPKMVTSSWHRPCSHHKFGSLTQCNSKTQSEWLLLLRYLLLSTCTISCSVLIISFIPNFHITSYQYSQAACLLFCWKVRVLSRPGE